MARTATRAKKPKRRQSSSTRIGRPSKCTPKLVAAIADRIRKGMGRETAARQAGIGVATFHEWMARGRAGDQPYADFVRRIEGASDELQEEVSGALTDALRDVDKADLRTRTAMWLAERLWPDVYGRRSEVRTTGPDGGPVQVEAKVAVAPLITADVAAGLSPEQLAELAREFMAGRKG